MQPYFVDSIDIQIDPIDHTNTGKACNPARGKAIDKAQAVMQKDNPPKQRSLSPSQPRSRHPFGTDRLQRLPTLTGCTDCRR
jgi:hypothetical protein